MRDAMDAFVSTAPAPAISLSHARLSMTPEGAQSSEASLPPSSAFTLVSRRGSRDDKALHRTPDLVVAEAFAVAQEKIRDPAKCAYPFIRRSARYSLFEFVDDGKCFLHNMHPDFRNFFKAALAAYSNKIPIRNSVRRTTRQFIFRPSSGTTNVKFAVTLFASETSSEAPVSDRSRTMQVVLSPPCSIQAGFLTL
jgi:hypothetical protein